MELSQKLSLFRRQVKPCPAPGNGVHCWILSAANSAKYSGLTTAEAYDAIRSAMTRSPQLREIENAVEKAYGSKTQLRRTSSVQSKPAYSEAALKKLAGNLPGFGPLDLWKRSPIDPLTCSSLQYLEHMFDLDDNVVLLSRTDDGSPLIWRHSQERSYLDEQGAILGKVSEKGGFFLINPVDGIERINPVSGKPSVRSADNTLRYRHLLLESDRAPEALWLPAVAQLPLRIKSLVRSGGKSVHILVEVPSGSLEDWEKLYDSLFAKMTLLGADPCAMTNLRQSRLPGVMRREKGEWQELLFLNPHPDGTPICELPILRS
ncbi:MAG: hypothetical protein WCO60_11570 [Verrucomicrobiota bacterium]